MPGTHQYGSPAAFRRALTDKLRARAAASRWTLPQLQRQIQRPTTTSPQPAHISVHRRILCPQIRPATWPHLARLRSVGYVSGHPGR
jgi:hypothetical protein